MFAMREVRCYMAFAGVTDQHTVPLDSLISLDLQLVLHALHLSVIPFATGFPNAEGAPLGGSELNQLNGPQGIAIDSTGALLVRCSDGLGLGEAGVVPTPQKVSMMKPERIEWLHVVPF